MLPVRGKADPHDHVSLTMYGLPQQSLIAVNVPLMFMVRVTLKHLDETGDGKVPYELFLRHIRRTLPETRLALAHQVFDRMGKRWSHRHGCGLSWVMSRGHLLCDRFSLGKIRSECFEQLSVHVSHRFCLPIQNSWDKLPTTSTATIGHGTRHAKTFVSNNTRATYDGVFLASHSSAAVRRCCVADTDGDGLVHVDDIVRNYRPHAHPEVADGSREEEDVRREFLESFSGKLGHQRAERTRKFLPIDSGVDRLAEDPRAL